MYSRDVRPKWWLLYLTFPLVMGLFLVDSRLHLPDSGHELVQLGIVLLEIILVEWWLHANSSALRHMDDEEYPHTIHVIEFPPFMPTEVSHDTRPILPLPPIEIKGVLGDTFELDFSDAKSAPVDGNAHGTVERGK